MSDLKQSKYTTWAVNLKRVVELCSVVEHTNPVLTWHIQRRTEYTLSPRWQRSADGCLPDVYNMPDAFTQELRGVSFCRLHPLVLEAVEDLWSMLPQHKHGRGTFSVISKRARRMLVCDTKSTTKRSASIIAYWTAVQRDILVSNEMRGWPHSVNAEGLDRMRSRAIWR